MSGLFIRTITKFLRMKSSLIVSCMFLFTILTQPVVAQQSGISIHMVDVTLEAVLNEIEAKSNYYFLYNQKLIDTDQKVSIHMENASVDEGLKDVFQDLNIRYLVYGQQIILLPKEIDDEIVIADQRRVTGTILDAMTGEPLAGVNIRIAGTNIGAIADREGRYNLTVPGSNVSLVFSYIGYRTEAASVGERYVINIELLPAVETIEEIIVVGYGVQDKSVVTGAISKLESRQLENTSIMRAEQALKGRLSGIQVISNSGAPGAKLKLRIRGYGSNGVSDPLFIVDGLRNNNIDYLNPDDIASIEILKDAASAAIYGSEGANGVVLITTKRGSAGKSSLSYNFQQGWQSLIKKPELMNASKFSEYMEEAGLISGEPVDTDTDWIGEVFETSPYTKHHVSLSGGGNDITFLLSLAYLNQDGIVITSKDKFDRYNLMFNSDYRIFPWLKIGNNISYAHTTLREVSENSEYGSVITNALMMDPLTPVRYDQYIPLNIKALLDDGKKLVKDDEGKYFGVSDYVSGEIINPLVTLNTSSNKSDNDILTENIFAEIAPFKEFTFTSRFGFIVTSSNIHSYYPEFYYNATQYRTASLVAENNTTGRYWQWENFGTWTLSVKDFNMIMLAGMSASEDKIRYVNASGGPLTKDEENFADLSFIASQKGDEVSGTQTISRKVSYFTRFSFDYKTKYLFQMSLRRDAAGSDMLPPDKRWGIFPSLSAGWVISEEGFFPETLFISNFKIRISWGQNGSLSNLGSFQYSSDLVSSAVYPIRDNTFHVATWPGSLGNYELTWETSEQTDIGFDLRLFNDRLTFTMDYYNKKTKDLITLNTPPLETGNRASPVNAGRILNRGFEFSLEHRNKIGDFAYDFHANLSTLHNEVTDLNPGITRLNGAMINLWNATAFEKGKPVWYFRGYKTRGIDPSTGDPLFKDMNGVPGINEDDKTYIGSGIPKITFGTRINLIYNDFDFLVFMQGQSGNDIIMGLIRTDRPINNRLDYYYSDRWTPENTGGNKPRAGADPRMWNSDLVVFNGSYLRIKQIQLGYSIPESWLNRVNLSRIRAYVSIDDFFTFTEYPGIDPEGGSAFNNSLGIDRGIYPVSKKIILGASVVF